MEVTTIAVIINNQITIPVTLKLHPSKGSVNINVLKTHNNILSVIKWIEPIL